MRSIGLFFIIGVLLLGCTYFEVTNVIEPKVTIIGREVGLVYKLGNLTISDTIKPHKKKVEWISKNMENTKWSLYITFEESKQKLPYFHYYVNGIKLLKDSHYIVGVSEELLLANMDNISGFHLYKIDGEKVGEADEEIIEKKIAKVKEEVKANPDKYAPLDGQW